MVLSLRQIKRETRGLRHGNREVWQNRHAGVEALSRLHDLRLDEMARMGAGGRGVASVHPRGAGEGHQFFRHGGRLFARRQRGNPRPRAQGIFQAARRGDRDQGARGDGAERQRQGPVAQAHHGGDRRFAEAPRHGLRRSLPDPPLRSADPDGGDARSAERRRARRQGALYRRFVDVRVAVRAHARHRARQGARRNSSRCRTTTTSSIARKSAR